MSSAVTVPTSSAQELRLLRTPGQAAAVLHPERRRILEVLSGTPDSAAGLARRLGVPRQRLNYHLRELEKEGLVEAVLERRKGNCMERIVRAVARTWVISPEVLGALGDDPDLARDRFSSAYLVAASARTIRDLATLGSQAEAAGKRVATLTIETEVRFKDAADRAAFTEELATALGRLTARYHDADAPQGRTFRFVVGGHPAHSEVEP